MTSRILATFVVVSTLWAPTAWGGPRDFVISMNGFLGTTEQAAPVLEKLFRQLESTLGWPGKSINGAYYPDAAAGLQRIKQDSPGFAVVSHQMYFEHNRSLKMKVIGGMELSEGALSRFHVVTKKTGGPSSISDLAGRKIASPHLAETIFAEKVIFGGQLKIGSAAGSAILELVKQPLQALRQVHRGQADAAVVDEPVVTQLSTLPFGNELHVIHSSTALPPLPVVALGSSSTTDRAAMTKALLGLCDGTEGAALCKSLRLSAVRPANEKTYADLMRQMAR